MDHSDKAREIGREDSPKTYVAHLVDVFSAVRDILAEDGTLWVVIGDTYAARRSWQAPSAKGGPKHARAQAEAGGMRLDVGDIKHRDLIGIPWRLAFALRKPVSCPRGPGHTRPVRSPPGGFDRLRAHLHQIRPRETRNKRDVWAMAIPHSTGKHFAVFPEALAASCLLAGSRVGDMLIDPFMGSGTVGTVAARLGRRFVGCELNAAYQSLFPTGRSTA